MLEVGSLTLIALAVPTKTTVTVSIESTSPRELTTEPVTCAVPALLLVGELRVKTMLPELVVFRLLTCTWQVSAPVPTQPSLLVSPSAMFERRLPMLVRITIELTLLAAEGLPPSLRMRSCSLVVPSAALARPGQGSPARPSGAAARSPAIWVAKPNSAEAASETVPTVTVRLSVTVILSLFIAACDGTRPTALCSTRLPEIVKEPSGVPAGMVIAASLSFRWRCAFRA